MGFIRRGLVGLALMVTSCGSPQKNLDYVIPGEDTDALNKQVEKNLSGVKKKREHYVVKMKKPLNPKEVIASSSQSLGGTGRYLPFDVERGFGSSQPVIFDKEEAVREIIRNTSLDPLVRKIEGVMEKYGVEVRYGSMKSFRGNKASPKRGLGFSVDLGSQQYDLDLTFEANPQNINDVGAYLVFKGSFTSDKKSRGD